MHIFSRMLCSKRCRIFISLLQFAFIDMSYVCGIKIELYLFQSGILWQIDIFRTNPAINFTSSKQNFFHTWKLVYKENLYVWSFCQFPNRSIYPPIALSLKETSSYTCNFATPVIAFIHTTEMQKDAPNRIFPWFNLHDGTNNESKRKFRWEMKLDCLE